MTKKEDDQGAQGATAVEAAGNTPEGQLSHAVYSAVHEEFMKLRVKLHNVLDGRSDIDQIVYHAQNRACDAALAVLKGK